MQKPEVSIIIPIYRVPELYLKKCIESVMEQTLKNIEIILVDDGSPDQCGELCENYAKLDNRIVVIHKENGGLSSARNAGVKASSGTWVMFLDGDDYISSNSCMDMCEIGNKSHVDLVIAGMVKKYEKKSVPYTYFLKDGKIYKGEECKWLQTQLLNYNSNIATVASKLYKRQIMVENEIYHDEILKQGAEGIEFNIRIFEYISSAVFINREYYYYRYNENSITASFNETNFVGTIKCFETIRSMISEMTDKQNLISWFNNRVLYAVISAAISGYFNPDNKDSYVKRKNGFKIYCENAIVHEALNVNNTRGMSKGRIIVLWLIKHKIYCVINCIAYIRKVQKKNG